MLLLSVFQMKERRHRLTQNHDNLLLMSPISRLLLAGVVAAASVSIPSPAQVTDRRDYFSYKIQPGDVLYIKVWCQPTLTKSFVSTLAVRV
jgi:protein involved in polysaccharide export with SLBB domain